MDGIPVILRGFDLAEHFILALVHIFAVTVAAHRFEYRCAVALAAVCNGCAVLGKLKRREQAVGLADGGLHGLTDRPNFAGKLFMVFAFAMFPVDSGSSMPVLSPRPNRAAYLSSLSMPRSCPAE